MATPGELFQMMTSQMNDLAQQLFACVKRGEIERVAGMINGVDITNLVSDETTFHQNAMFFACQIKDEDLAFRMVQLLQQNSNLKLDRSYDTLKQTPLYYCVKEGF